MVDQRTCFVISPIGEKDTDIRRHADNFIRRIIQPALAGFSFMIIRVDQSFKDLRITDEIVSLIKNSELCVVDSINYNPNVMYELGRRHETGRPVLVFRPAGQPIIFDLKDIKHIEYDLDQVDSVIEVQNFIRLYLDEFDRQGFISTHSSANIENISATIDRVERRIDDIVAILTQKAPVSDVLIGGSPSSVNQLVESLGLDRAFTYCIRNNLVRESEVMLSMIEPRLSVDNLRWYLCRIASLGSRVAFSRLKNEIVPIINQLSMNDARIYIGYYVTASNVLDRDLESIDLLKPIIIEDLIERRREEIDSKTKASLLNQLGRLHSGSKDHKTALSYYEDAILNDPYEPVFLYNAADTAQIDANIEKALHYADKLKHFCENQSIQDVDADHLSVLYKIYIQNNRQLDANWAVSQLEAKNPLLAKILTSEKY